MNFSVNGQSQVPPGFRFHPTEEELLHYYLRKKVASKKIDLDVIRDVDLNKLEPWDIQEKCRIGSTPQNDWYFFSHKDKKYPTGTRTNRATAAGFWKATGRDKVIYSNSKRIGMRKTLVFYKGRAPHGQKSDWIMHEYRLDENNTHAASLGEEDPAISSGEDGWVVCRVFKKKNYHKAVESCQNSSTAATPSTSMDSRNNNISVSGNINNDGILDRILGYMGRSCKQDAMQLLTNGNTNLIVGDNPLLHAAKSTTFMHLPRLLETPWPTPTTIINDSSSALSPEDGGFGACDQQSYDIPTTNERSPTATPTLDDDGPKLESGGLTNWVALDRLVASQLNAAHDDIGGPTREDIFSFPLLHEHQITNSTACLPGNNLRPNSACNRTTNSNQPSLSSDQVYMMVSNGEDFWSFAGSPSSSSSDPLCHLSV